MKESTLIEIKNKVDTLGNLFQQVTLELRNLRDLSVGTMELVKKFEGYEEALEKLKEEIKEEDGKQSGISESMES